MDFFCCRNVGSDSKQNLKNILNFFETEQLNAATFSSCFKFTLYFSRQFRKELSCFLRLARQNES